MGGGFIRPGELEISGRMKAGVTLVELLVAVVVMVIVVAAALSIFNLGSRHEARQQEIVIQLQNLRAALYTIGRDVRMAGSGMRLTGASNYHIFVSDAVADDNTQNGSGWFRYINEDETRVVRIMGTDSGSLKPVSTAEYSEESNKPARADTLTILRFDVESPTEVGRLSSSFSPGAADQRINLHSSVTEGKNIEDGDMVAVVDGNIAVIVQARLNGSRSILEIGERFRPENPLPSAYTFPEGSWVYNLRDITFVSYFVDTENKRLVANYHDDTIIDRNADNSAQPHLVTIADNIEDFQVQYFLSNATEAVSAAGIDINSHIVAVRLALVSRTRAYSEIGAKENGSIEVFDHKAADEKGYSRRLLFETIQLRN